MLIQTSTKNFNLLYANELLISSVLLVRVWGVCIWFLTVLIYDNKVKYWNTSSTPKRFTSSTTTANMFIKHVLLTPHEIMLFNREFLFRWTWLRGQLAARGEAASRDQCCPSASATQWPPSTAPCWGAATQEHAIACSNSITGSLSHSAVGDSSRFCVSFTARDHGWLCSLPLQNPGRLARPGTSNGGQRWVGY